MGKQYRASTSVTVTALHSLASSQDQLAGWGSDNYSNGGNLDDAILAGFSFVTHASNRQNGAIYIYVVAPLDTTPTYPSVASGTLGTQGAVGFTDSEERDAIAKLLTVITVDNSVSATYATTAYVNEAFGGRLPKNFCFFVTQNCSTTTTAGLAASGSTINLTGEYRA